MSRNLADVLCADLKLSPNVLKKSDCGIAHEFICGEVLTEEELHNASDELLRNIARKCDMIITFKTTFQPQIQNSHTSHFRVTTAIW